MQGLSAMDYTPKGLQLLYSVQVTSRQGGQFSICIGRLQKRDIKGKILAYRDG
jgi:hypothetical protein